MKSCRDFCRRFSQAPIKLAIWARRRQIDKEWIDGLISVAPHGFPSGGDARDPSGLRGRHRLLLSEGIVVVWRKTTQHLGPLSFLAWTLWQLGYPDQALAKSQHALAIAQEGADPLLLNSPKASWPGRQPVLRMAVPTFWRCRLSHIQTASSRKKRWSYSTKH